MAQPAAEGWGEEGMAAKPVELDWSTEASKVEVVTRLQPSIDVSGAKCGQPTKSAVRVVAMPILPKHRSLNTSHQTVSQPTIPGTPASRGNIAAMPRTSASRTRQSTDTQASPAQAHITGTPPATKPASVLTPSPTSSAPSPHSQDIWDTPIPSKSSSSTPSSSITNHNTTTWSDTNGKHASSPLTSRSQTYKQSRASTPKTQKPQDQWEGRDGCADAVQLRQKHLEQTRRNMQSEVNKTEGEGQSVSGWW